MAGLALGAMFGVASAAAMSGNKRTQPESDIAFLEVDPNAISCKGCTEGFDNNDVCECPGRVGFCVLGEGGNTSMRAVAQAEIARRHFDKTEPVPRFSLSCDGLPVADGATLASFRGKTVSLKVVE